MERNSSVGFKKKIQLYKCCFKKTHHHKKMHLSAQFLCSYSKTRCPLQYSYLRLPILNTCLLPRQSIANLSFKSQQKLFSTVKASRRICFSLLSFSRVYYFLNHYESTVAGRWARDCSRHSVCEKINTVLQARETRSQHFSL